MLRDWPLGASKRPGMNGFAEFSKHCLRKWAYEPCVSLNNCPKSKSPRPRSTAQRWEFIVAGVLAQLGPMLQHVSSLFRSKRESPLGSGRWGAYEPLQLASNCSGRAGGEGRGGDKSLPESKFLKFWSSVEAKLLTLFLYTL